jgi:hypothetical protein
MSSATPVPSWRGIAPGKVADFVEEPAARGWSSAGTLSFGQARLPLTDQVPKPTVDRCPISGARRERRTARKCAQTR